MMNGNSYKMVPKVPRLVPTVQSQLEKNSDKTRLSRYDPWCTRKRGKIPVGSMCKATGYKGKRIQGREPDKRMPAHELMLWRRRLNESFRFRNAIVYSASHQPVLRLLHWLKVQKPSSNNRQPFNSSLTSLALLRGSLSLPHSLSCDLSFLSLLSSLNPVQLINHPLWLDQFKNQFINNGRFRFYPS